LSNKLKTYQKMKTTYKGFKVGEKVMLNVSGSHNEQHIDKGTMRKL